MCPFSYRLRDPVSQSRASQQHYRSLYRSIPLSLSSLFHICPHCKPQSIQRTSAQKVGGAKSFWTTLELKRFDYKSLILYIFCCIGKNYIFLFFYISTLFFLWCREKAKLTKYNQRKTVKQKILIKEWLIFNVTSSHQQTVTWTFLFERGWRTLK